jgi:hypothetical protein
MQGKTVRARKMVEDKEQRCTAKEGSVRNQYKYLVPIYVFSEMKLCSLLISKPEL